ncbi:hypothetical protein P7M70_24545, partial [Vibrio parahaemolyticus]|nr:hypothetical protein [Vibrio parahaemolyticus]
KRRERKFPIKEWEKEKKERRKEGKKAPDQGSKENRRNVQRGLWTGQYLNNTELSPNERKEGKETMT